MGVTSVCAGRGMQAGLGGAVDRVCAVIRTPGPVHLISMWSGRPAWSLQGGPGRDSSPKGRGGCGWSGGAVMVDCGQRAQSRDTLRWGQEPQRQADGSQQWARGWPRVQTEEWLGHHPTKAEGREFGPPLGVSSGALRAQAQCPGPSALPAKTLLGEGQTEAPHRTPRAAAGRTVAPPVGQPPLHPQGG